MTAAEKARVEEVRADELRGILEMVDDASAKLAHASALLEGRAIEVRDSFISRGTIPRDSWFGFLRNAVAALQPFIVTSPGSAALELHGVPDDSWPDFVAWPGAETFGDECRLNVGGLAIRATKEPDWKDPANTPEIK